MFRTRFMANVRFVLPALLFPMFTGCSLKDAANAAQGGLLSAISGAFESILTSIIFSGQT